MGKAEGRRGSGGSSAPPTLPMTRASSAAPRTAHRRKAGLLRADSRGTAVDPAGEPFGAGVGLAGGDFDVDGSAGLDGGVAARCRCSRLALASSRGVGSDCCSYGCTLAAVPITVRDGLFGVAVSNLLLLALKVVNPQRAAWTGRASPPLPLNILPPAASLAERTTVPPRPEKKSEEPETAAKHVLAKVSNDGAAPLGAKCLDLARAGRRRGKEYFSQIERFDQVAVFLEARPSSTRFGHAE